MKRKFLSMLLAFCMVLTTTAVNPAIVSAANDDGSAPVRITSNPSIVRAVDGDTVEFTVGATGGSGAGGNERTYQWQYRTGITGAWNNCSDTVNLETGTLSFVADMSRNNWFFRCVVTAKDESSTATSGNARLVVTAKKADTREAANIQFSKQPVNIKVKEGETATFTAEAKGADGIVYKWQYRKGISGSWNDMSDSNTTTLTVTATADQDRWFYRCVASTADGSASATSSGGQLTVEKDNAIKTNTSIIKVAEQPVNASVKEGDTVTFTAKGAGADSFTYQWQYRKGISTTWNDVAGATSSTLQLTATKDMNNNNYRCKIMADTQSVYTSAARLTVADANGEKVDIRISRQPSNVAVVAGETAKFSVAVTSDGKQTYQWQYRNGVSGAWSNCENGNSTELSFKTTLADNNKNYRCEITASDGRTKLTTDTVKLTVTEKTATTAEMTKITSQPADVTVDAGKTAKFTVSASGKKLTYQWQSRPGITGDWTNVSGGTAAALSVTAKAEQDGWFYRCAVTGADKKTAYSDAAKLTVKVTTVAATAEITKQPENVTVDEGKTATFTIAAKGTGITYQWQYRKGISGAWVNCTDKTATSATLSVTTKFEMSGWNYRCVVTANDKKTTATSFTVKLTVNQKVVAKKAEFTTNPASATSSENEAVTFTVKVANMATPKYQWQVSTDNGKTWKNNTDGFGNTSSSLGITAKLSMNGYQYRCVASDSAGNKITSSVAKLTVKQPELSISQQPQAVIASANVNAKFTVGAVSAKTFTWQVSTDNGKTWKNSTIGTAASGASLLSSSAASSSSTYTVKAEASMNGYLFRCVAKDASGKTVTSESALLTVSNYTLIRTQPQDTTVESGAKATFSITCTDQVVSYQWQSSKDGKTWTDCTNSNAKKATMTFTAKETHNGKQFRCVVKDKDGASATSAAATLTVPIFYTVTVAYSDVSIPQRSYSYMLSATSVSAQIPAGDSFTLPKDKYGDTNSNILGFSTSKGSSTVAYKLGETISSVQKNLTLYPVYGSITAKTNNVTANVGETKKLELTVTPSTLSVTYSSSDTSVATVDKSGNVKFLKAGSVIITPKATINGKACTDGVQYIVYDAKTAPANLTATYNAVTNQVVLKWNDVTFASSYTVQRRDKTANSSTWTSWGSPTAGTATQSNEVLLGVADAVRPMGVLYNPVPATKPGGATYPVPVKETSVTYEYRVCAAVNGKNTAYATTSVEVNPTVTVLYANDAVAIPQRSYSYALLPPYPVEGKVPKGGSETVKIRVQGGDTHCNIVGYNTKKDGTGTMYKDGDVIKNIQKDITLYPVYAVLTLKSSTSSCNVEVGGTGKLTAAVEPAKYVANQTYTYTSSDPAVVKVDKSGNVSFLKAGSSIVTVSTTINGKTCTNGYKYIVYEQANSYSSSYDPYNSSAYNDDGYNDDDYSGWNAYYDSRDYSMIEQTSAAWHSAVDDSRGELHGVEYTSSNGYSWSMGE